MQAYQKVMRQLGRNGEASGKAESIRMMGKFSAGPSTLLLLAHNRHNELYIMAGIWAPPGPPRTPRLAVS
jgi:hypothetical protein